MHFLVYIIYAINSHMQLILIYHIHMMSDYCALAARTLCQRQLELERRARALFSNETMCQQAAAAAVLPSLLTRHCCMRVLACLCVCVSECTCALVSLQRSVLCWW